MSFGIWALFSSIDDPGTTTVAVATTESEEPGVPVDPPKVSPGTPTNSIIELPDTPPPATWGPRKIQMDQWLQSGIALAKKSGYPGAIEVADLLGRKGKTATPRPAPELLEPIEDNGQKDWIAIIPIIEEDKKVDPVWYVSLRAELFAYMTRVNDSCQLIVLKDSRGLSPISKGLIILHEGKHALDQRQWYKNSSDETEHAKSELNAQELEFAVCERLFGEKFKTAGKILAKDISAKYTANPTMQTLMDAESSSMGSQIRELFGPINSNRDLEVFGTTLSIYAKFVALEQVHGKSEAREKKIEMLIYWANKMKGR